MWTTKDLPIIQPKTKGSRIIVSNSIDEHSGYLRLSYEEHSHAKAGDPNFPDEARFSLYVYEADWEGYWTPEAFSMQLNLGRVCTRAY